MNLILYIRLVAYTGSSVNTMCSLLSCYTKYSALGSTRSFHIVKLQALDMSVHWQSLHNGKRDSAGNACRPVRTVGLTEHPNWYSYNGSTVNTYRWKLQVVRRRFFPAKFRRVGFSDNAIKTTKRSVRKSGIMNLPN